MSRQRSGPVYLRYTKKVDQQSITNLMNISQEQIRKGVGHLIVLISSTGGNVHWGMTAYTFLKGLPIKVDMHAFGRVNSVAIPMYCSGETRYATTNSSFLMHGVGFNVPQGSRFDLKRLTERITSLQNDTNAIARAISENCEKSIDDVKKYMYEGTILTAEQALEYTIVHEIKNELFPINTPIINI